MRTASGFMLAALGLAGACTQTLDGAPCPCAGGYECCATENVCLPRGAVCKTPTEPGGGGRADGSGGGGAPAGATSSAGSTSSAGTTVGTAMGGSANGGTDDGGRGGRGDARAGTAGSVAGGGRAAGASGASGAIGGSAGTGGGDETGTAGLAGRGDDEPVFALVATQHNDTTRTGANLTETALDAANVRVGTFGELSRRPLRGAVFAQPLVAPGVELGGGSPRDVLLVATMANVVYALDARQPEAAPLWTRELGAPVELPTAAIAYGAQGIWHELGVLGTPVLSPVENALYAVAASQTGETFAHTLYKLDLRSGQVLASVPIASDGFDSAVTAQRAALTLSGDVLFVPFGGYDAGSSASGWVFAFDHDLAPLGHVALGTPSGSGITMSGDGPTVDTSGSLYFTTGLGGTASSDATAGYGARLLALDDASAPRVSEKLLPSAALSGSDELASSGPLLLPGANRAVVAGEHRMYVVDTSADAASAPLQELRVSAAMVCENTAAYCQTEPSSPVFWPGSGAAPVPRVFVWSPSDLLRAFAFDPEAGHLDCDGGDTPCSPLASIAPRDAYDAQNRTLAPSAHLSVSSNGTQSGTGVVWALQPYATEVTRSPDGILRAFDAERLESLWSSQRAGEPLGPIARGALPTVSGGRAFVGTVDGISNKTVFWDASTGGSPALTSYDDELLVLAWGFLTPNNQGFQLAWSSDGATFDDASTIFSTFLGYEPALTASESRIYLAWTTPEQHVKVLAAVDPSFVGATTLLGDADSSLTNDVSSGPALAYGDHHLFVAWHTETSLELLASADGVTFEPANHVTLPDYVSFSAPLLTYLDGKLYLGTTGYGGVLDLFVSTDDGAHFGEPTRLPMLSAGHPALVNFQVNSGAAPDQVLLWTSPASAGATFGQIAAATARDGSFDFARQHVFQEDSAEGSISAARFHGSAYIAWMGTSGAPHPNVARYSTGELVTYGLR